MIIKEGGTKKSLEDAATKAVNCHLKLLEMPFSYAGSLVASMISLHQKIRGK